MASHRFHVRPGTPVFSVGKEKRAIFWAVWRCVSDIHEYGSFRPLKEPIAHGQCSSVEEGIALALGVEPNAVRIHNYEATRWQGQAEWRRDEVQGLFADALDLFERCEEDGTTLEEEEEYLDGPGEHRAWQLATRVGSVAGLRLWGVAVGVMSAATVDDDQGEEEIDVMFPEDHYAGGA